MAITTERLIVQLEARLDKYERNLAKASGSTDRAFKRIETRGKKFEARFGAIGARLGGIFAGAVTLRGAQTLIDAATRVENSLKVAGLSGDELTKVYGRLFDSAQKSAAPLEALVELYGRAAQVQKELGVTSEELLGFTDNIAVALRVSGKSASESSGALLQLSQALGSGVVRSEEFNSILEGALPIAQAAAAGLDEAGGSVAKLRGLVIDGKVSSEAFFRAFEAGSVILEQKVAGAELTVSQSFTRLTNVLIDTAGKLNDATGASERLGDAINTVAGLVSGFGTALDDVSDSALGGYIGQVVEAYDKTSNLIKVLGGLPGLLKTTTQLQMDLVQGRELGGGAQNARINSRIEGAFDRVDPKTGRLPQSEKINTDAKVSPVSLKSFAPPKSKSSGGSGGSAKKQNDFAREVQQIRDRTAALQSETVVMSGLNPLIDDYGFSLEKARAKQELLNAANKAGLTITPELASQIDALAEQYAMASAEGDKLKESQDRIRKSADEMNAQYAEMGSYAGDIFSQIVDGSLSAEDGLKKLAIAFVQAYVKAKLLSSINTSTAGGGFLSSLIGSVFGGFRAAGGPVSAGKAYMVGERGPEMIVPKSAGTVIPNRSLGGSGGASITINAPINAPNANGPELAALRQSVNDLGKNIPKMVDARNATKQMRGVRA